MQMKKEEEMVCVMQLCKHLKAPVESVLPGGEDWCCDTQRRMDFRVGGYDETTKCLGGITWYSLGSLICLSLASLVDSFSELHTGRGAQGFFPFFFFFPCLFCFFFSWHLKVSTWLVMTGCLYKDDRVDQGQKLQPWQNEEVS